MSTHITPTIIIYVHVYTCIAECESVFSFLREDFKMVLREVRRKNHNTLSGLSLDSIAEQVRAIIEAKERAKGGGGEGAKAKPRAPLPPVALAPPPVNSAMEYTEEWSCVICYEDMDANDSSRLVCGHRFHTEVQCRHCFLYVQYMCI